MRNLILILGDQLDRQSAAFDGLDPAIDTVWMAETAREANKVWSSKPRIAVFLAAMRHFCAELEADGVCVHYDDLSAGHESFAHALRAAVKRLRPKALVVVEAGEYDVREELRAVARDANLPLDERTDRHFLTTHAEFAAHAAARKQLRMEYFYREMRRRHNVLMDGTDPAGGEWNYDAENRKSFGKAGPSDLTAPPNFAPDEITRAVLQDVEAHFGSHPGSLADFAWPVTRRDALRALRHFVKYRLTTFGDHQDAMWTSEPFLSHSLLSAALNLKLLNPREVIAAAEAAYRGGDAPITAVEGFIRQILGWREYVRGVYWQFMPEYRERNGLQASAPLPDFYWTGATDMVCLRETIEQTLRYGYAHHIQRLMVTGLFALLLGVEPRQVHEWYLAVYVDAVEWAELPNTLGMSQFGDGGVMASKPYVASGRYIERMSNYCRSCRFGPAARTGTDACPFTTLYWDFLARHESQLKGNRRMDMQLKNLAGIGGAERRAIRAQADALRVQMAGKTSGPRSGRRQAPR
jgi:deoxyribodipyrimidine photolyase-related protein